MTARKRRGKRMRKKKKEKEVLSLRCSKAKVIK